MVPLSLTSWFHHWAGHCGVWHTNATSKGSIPVPLRTHISSLWWSSSCCGGILQALKTITFLPKLSSPVSRKPPSLSRKCAFEVTRGPSRWFLEPTGHFDDVMACDVVEGVVPRQVRRAGIEALRQVGICGIVKTRQNVSDAFIWRSTSFWKDSALGFDHLRTPGSPVPD